MPYKILLKSRLYMLLAATAIASAITNPVPTLAAAGTNATDVPAKNGIRITMNGKDFQAKSAPFVDHGTIYLPLRDVGELLGTLVSWNGAAKTVTMNYPDLKVKLEYGSLQAMVNGKQFSLNAPLRMVDGRLFVPLRFFSEATGADVKWEDSIKTVNITKEDDFIKAQPWSSVWLNRKTSDLYMARDEQSPAIHVGKLDTEIQGDVSFHDGLNQGGNTVLTIVDHYGDSRSHYDVYGLLIRGNKIVAQKKANYEKRYEPNTTYFQVYDPNGWIEYTVLTDGKIVTIFNNQGKVVKEYDLPKLSGTDDVFSVLAVGEDYLVVRPNQSGLLTLIDLKDHSTVVLADKLLTGKDLEYARNHKDPYPGDTLSYAGDMGHGVLDFYYASPFNGKEQRSVRLTYERPSYEDERKALPKGRSIKELASVCTPKTISSIEMQDGDMMYVPLIGANEKDKDSIRTVCSILQKFAAKGVEETLPYDSPQTFFHGMYVNFTEGESISMYQYGGKLALGSAFGGKTMILDDHQSVQDFNRLKVVPTSTFQPNPVHIGKKVHFKGNIGGYKESEPLIISWAPDLNKYSSQDPDRSLVIFTGTMKFGSYDVQFTMPAYGKAADGTMKPLQPGKGTIKISNGSYGNVESTSIELLPESK
ncbi:copper amine oxidase N-terminal domain-containing protein [Paenibacillus azoreducens]|uniref:copper amine oxidase N-terminal domain-containing protein n=1 Tax=Paenibacillus azoreducens TaxID=116718 RepID=UPI0039F5ABF4